MNKLGFLDALELVLGRELGKILHQATFSGDDIQGLVSESVLADEAGEGNGGVLAYKKSQSLIQTLI